MTSDVYGATANTTKVCTGIILLEAMLIHRMYQTGCQSVGGLKFTCSRERRDELLATGYVTMAMISAGEIVLGWFDPVDALRLIYDEDDTLSGPVIYNACATLAMDNSMTITSSHTALCDNWNFIGMMDTWCRQLGVCDMIDITGDSDARGLEPIEQTWAFLHIATRWLIETPRWSSSMEMFKSTPTDLFACGQIDSCRKFNTAAMMMYGEYEKDW